MRALAIAAVLLLPAMLVAPSASADSTRLTLGAAAGLSQDKADGGDESAQSLGLWGRLQLTKRIAGQVELAKQETQFGCATCTFGTTSTIRTYTGLMVVDLADSGSWMPILLAGIGIDRDSGSFPTSGRHIEGGFGIEYRSTAGLMIGADVRMGGRTIDQQDMILETDPALVGGDAQILRPGLRAGEYRSARITFGVRF
jgi:hypothetical protein